MSTFDDIEDFDEDDVDVELQKLLNPSASPAADVPKKVRKPRFFCAGAKRIDERTEKKWCDYKAYYKWYTVCPKCHRPFACLPMKKGKATEKRVTLGQATMSAHKDMVYYSTGIPELDKVLGGGVVYEKTLLLGASRGSGKSTLLLQACDGFAKDGRKAYFASGEMTQNSIIDYAKRLGISNDNIGMYGDPLGVDVDELFDDVLAFGAKFVVLDSVQVATMSDVKGDIGKPTMVDAVTNMMTSFAQEKQRAIIMIGHLEKTGNFGGTEAMQHLVDGLVKMDTKYCGVNSDGKPIDSMIREIYMDGKSRQGRSDITSLVEMTDTGMRSPSPQALRKLVGGIHLA